MRDRVKILVILVVLEVKTSLILGSEFWRAMGIVPDLRSGEWVLTSEPTVQLGAIEGRPDLTSLQEEQLQSLLDEKFSRLMGRTIGCTDKAEHKITTDSPPI